jgi:hypothetical protein
MPHGVSTRLVGPLVFGLVGAGAIGRKLYARQVGTPAPVGHDRGPACRRNEPCPCGSGRKAKKCCRRAS